MCTEVSEEDYSRALIIANEVIHGCSLEKKYFLVSIIIYVMIKSVSLFCGGLFPFF